MFNWLKRMQLRAEISTLQMQKQLQDMRQTAGVQNSGMPLSGARRGSELYELLTGGTPGSAGVVVNERTAMCVSAVYACVRLIAGAIGSLPLPVYQRTNTGRERADHDLWWLLNEQPTPLMSATAFWEYIITSKLLYGDAFARIVRQPGTGLITGFYPIHPDRVAVTQDGGLLYYTVLESDGTTKGYGQDKILHFPGVGFDGLRSLSPIRYAARQAVGIALAADEFSARFFSNGARPDIILEIPGVLTAEQVDLIRRTWVERYAGVDKSHLPGVASGGLKVHPLTINAEEAQLIATRQFQIGDIARVYGVPPWMIGETDKQSSWGTGVEQTGIGFVKYTLTPHLTGIEQEINRKCFGIARYFVEFNRDGLMEGDAKSQSEYFGKALGGPGAQGWLSVNEVRRLKNLPPLDGYDNIPHAGSTVAKQPDLNTTT